jgi:hypothetical protein
MLYIGRPWGVGSSDFITFLNDRHEFSASAAGIGHLASDPSQSPPRSHVQTHLRITQLILQAYAPSHLVSPDDLKRLQHELFEIQKRPEAWGLVIPLLEHGDQNVQFFGAHTAQVKIARDWWALYILSGIDGEC